MNPSLILIPASSPDSEVSFTLHPPGESDVKLKTVQGSSCLSFILPDVVLLLEQG
ncbi:hypothetical protein MNBD_NITROSPIRAE02-1512 [hydrothermal vent metagenome]|uniref:Uncharacterized protein n=1 Tax=hydrothermal vent metagenome TaxID=652676 RepID=A0A3B1DN43_9ZZZZ